jgi:outer membrane protein TolC
MKVIYYAPILAIGFVSYFPSPQTFAQSVPGVTPSVPQNIDQLNPDPDLLLRPGQEQSVAITGTYAITLEQAVELAFRNNLQLQSRGVTFERAQAALREARAALYPSVAVSGGVSRQENILSTQSSSLSTQFADTGSNGASNALSGTVSVSYSLFTSGQRSANIRVAKQQVRYDELGIQILTEQTLQDVSNDYYALQNADELVRIQRSAVKNAQESYRIAVVRERAGVGTGFDVLQSKVQLANATQNLTSAVNDQKTARRQLAQRLNVAQTVDLVAADPVQATGTWPLTLEQSIVLAFKNRLELEQFLIQREIARQNRRAALAALGPTVSLSGSWDISHNFGSGSDTSSGYSVGANVDLAVFDGGAARARAKQSEKDMKTAELNFADTRNQIRFNVEQAYFSLQSSRDNIQTTALAVQEAEEALRLARLRYDAGVGTQTDVINSENSLTESQGNRIRAIIEYNQALAALFRNVGSINRRE